MLTLQAAAMARDEQRSLNGFEQLVKGFGTVIFFGGGLN